MSSKRTVTVFGASGRMGQAQVAELLRAGVTPRAVTRRPAMFERPEFTGAEIVIADYDDPPALVAACTGADAIFYSPPTVALADSIWRHSLNVVAAAKVARVPQFVHNSTMWAPDEPCGQALYDFVLAIENLVAGSGLPFIIFRPVLFMDNFLTLFAKPGLIREGLYRYCQRPGLEATWISMGDLAKFMVAAVGRQDLSARRFCVGGPQTLAVEDALTMVSSAMGKPLRYHYETPYEFGARMHGVLGMGDEISLESYATFFDSFYTFNNESALRPFVTDIGEVLGELPITLTSFQDWARQQDWTNDPSKAAFTGSRSR